MGCNGQLCMYEIIQVLSAAASHQPSTTRSDNSYLSPTSLQLFPFLPTRIFSIFYCLYTLHTSVSQQSLVAYAAACILVIHTNVVTLTIQLMTYQETRH